MVLLLLCRFEFRRKYELYFESSKLGSAESGSLLYQPVSGNMSQNVSKTSKKSCPSFGTTLRQLFFKDGDEKYQIGLVSRVPSMKCRLQRFASRAPNLYPKAAHIFDIIGNFMGF